MKTFTVALETPSAQVKFRVLFLIIVGYIVYSLYSVCALFVYSIDAQRAFILSRCNEYLNELVMASAIW